MTILSIQVGKPKRQVTHDGKEWRSGIYKEPVLGPVWAGKTNLDGDGQQNLNVHGGPDRPVLIVARSGYAHWEQHLAKELPNGAFGENLTVDGQAEDSICLGDVWRSKNVVMEVSQPRLPCNNLSRRLGEEGIHLKIMATYRCGWYLRVLEEGEIEAGETLELVARPHPEWTIERAFRTFLDKDADGREELKSLPSLCQLWKEAL